MPLTGLFANRYLLTENMREGGTATVYKAATSDESYVAVKIFNHSAVEDEFLQQMFYNEVESLSRLKHNNIVHMIDSGIDPTTKRLYVVLEWIEHSLAQWRDIYRADLDWYHLASKVVLPLLDAMAFAHGRGVRHRDIKPSNILLEPDGTPKIADFGIAKIVDTLRTGVTVNQFGARPYMPPEYWQSSFPLATPEGDMYSLGITILKVLASRGFPIGADFVSSTTNVNAALEHLNLHNSALQFISKLSQPEPQDRFFNAEVAYEELKALLRSRRVQVTERLTYFVALTNSVRGQLKLSHGHRTDHDIQDFFERDVSTAAIKLDDKSSLQQPAFHLFGEELVYELIVPAAEPHKLIMRSANPMSSPDAFIKLRDRAMAIAARWSFASATNKTAATKDIGVLVERLQAHAAESQTDELAVEEREMYAKWRSGIQARRDLISGAMFGYTYTGLRHSGSQVVFHVTGVLDETLFDDQIIWRIAAERVFVQLKIIYIAKNEIRCVIRRGKAEAIPNSGRIEVDTSTSLVPLNRQERALNDTENRTSRRPDLGRLLAWPGEMRTPKHVDQIDVLTAEFDDAKLKALRMALGTDDMVVVEGPPGTGKTTWIAELVYQELEREPEKKVLLSAQTNIAVDNALEQILKLRPDTRAIRIVGPTTELSPSIASCELSSCLAIWAGEVKHASNRWMEDFRSNLLSKTPCVSLHEQLRLLNHYDVQYTNATMELNELLTESEKAKLTGASTMASAVALKQKHQEVSDLLKTAGRDADDVRFAMATALDDDEILTAPLSSVSEKVNVWWNALPEDVQQEVKRFEKLSWLQTLWVQRFGDGEAFEEHLLSLADIVAGTCVGIERAFRRDSLELAFGLVIIDEASKATPTETLVPMSRGERFVFVGDQKQLPPYIERQMLTPAVRSKYNLDSADLTATLFDRLIQQLPSSCRAMLDTQYRMVPEIGNLISECFYKSELKTGRPPSTINWLREFMARPVIWFSTSNLSQKLERKDVNSFRNLEECRRIVDWLQELDEVAEANQTILRVGVISGYLSQVKLLEEELGCSVSEATAPITQWRSLDVSVNTVDTIQGRQVDIVVYSVTRSNTRSDIGHLSSYNRLNVALSRGKEGLVLFGDVEHCYSSPATDNPFPKVIQYVRSNSEACLEVTL